MARAKTPVEEKPKSLEEMWPRRWMYGTIVPAGRTNLEVELMALKNKLNGGNRFKTSGPEEHFRRIAKMGFPDLEWHEWMDRRVKAFCEYNVCVHAGAASSGKTHDAALMAMIYWQCDPRNTAVVLTSTTREMIRKRIWPVIRKLYYSTKMFNGNMVDSKTALQAEEGDDKHGVFAIAVKDGNVAKAAANIQGMHPKRMMIVIDEATDTPEAIFEVIPNLRSAVDDFRLIVIGNPNSRLDPHGVCAEPKKGWTSITVDSDEWLTAGVPKWDIDPGICLHFDGMKNPNIKAGHRKFKFLTNQADMDRTKTAEAENTLWFWKYRRGFWAPEGTVDTVFTETMLRKWNAFEMDAPFRDKGAIYSGVDPSFGGADRGVQYFANVGEDLRGNIVIKMLPPKFLVVRPKSPDPMHVQLAEQVMNNAVEMGVAPEHLGMDTTGEGGGLADHLVRTWGNNRFKRIEFGGSASKRPVSREDQRPGSDVYYNQVTQLWYGAREFVAAGQVRGVSNELSKELTARMVLDATRKKQVEKKVDMQMRVGFSPDLADAFVVLLEVVRQNLGDPIGVGNAPKNESREWRKLAQREDELTETEEHAYAADVQEMTFESLD